MNEPCDDTRMDATDLLVQASDAIHHRAELRDQPDGERSMTRTVAAFNSLYGTQLTVVQGWQFMQLLKLARATAGRFHVDDYVDMAAYAALAGEAAAPRAMPDAAIDRAIDDDARVPLTSAMLGARF